MKTLRKSKIDELINFDSAFGCPVIGTDEAGRGPIAGPVVASAVFFPEFTPEVRETIKFIDDSKKLTPKLREELAEQIKKVAKYSICESSVEEIEKYNILQASLLAMKRACDDLLNRHSDRGALAPSGGISKDLSTRHQGCLARDDKLMILVDGKFIIPSYIENQKAVKKGDSLSASIAAASILAKVYRDELMQDLAEKFPVYGWSKNKGYPTRTHIEAVKAYGYCEWHRKNFCIKEIVNFC